MLACTNGAGDILSQALAHDEVSHSWRDESTKGAKPETAEAAEKDRNPHVLMELLSVFSMFLCIAIP